MKNNILWLTALACGLTFTADAQRARRASVPQVIATTAEIAATEAASRMQGYQTRQVLAEKSIVKNLNFRNVGPTQMSGRVVDIDANPANPTEFYVAYASGGLWHTKNNGQSFETLFDNEAVMTIGDIAVDWKTNTIWVGTGESNSSRSSYAGVGIYKSSDGGKTWQHLGLPDTQHIGRIQLHPSNPQVAWVAAVGHLYSPNAERGIFKTTDGGKTWKKTLYINDVTGAIDLQVNPQNPNDLFATMWNRERSAWNFKESGSTSGIYRSNDGGESWQLISTPTSGFPQGETNGRIGLAIYPKNPNVMYAIIDNQAKKPAEKKEEEKTDKLTKKQMRNITKEEFLNLPDKLLSEYLDDMNFPERFTAKQLKADVKSGKIQAKDVFLYTHNDNDDLFDIQIQGAEIYRSENGGKTWAKTSGDNLEGLWYTYGYYFGQVWVDPNDDQRVVTAGVPVIISTDGAKTFKSIDGGNVHADHHALWINPANSNHFILGNDGGVNITYDGGKTWFKANSLPVGQFYHVAVDMAKPYNVYGGLQDNGVWVGPSTNNFDFNFGIFESGDGFDFLLGGDGMQVQVDWRDNNTLYAGFQFGNYFRINRKTGERKYLQVPREMGEEQLRFNWESPITISRHNQDIIYFGSHKFHRSFDKGDTWKTISGDLTRGKREGNVPFGTLTSIEESPMRFGLLYVGSDDGLVHISKDGGYSWDKIADKPGLWCAGVVPSAHEQATVYAAFNGYRQDHFAPYLYASTDYGKTWQAIGTDLPAEPINVVREDPVNRNILYVGTDNGLYISIDRGKTFMNVNGKTLPNVAIHDLVIHPRDGELVLGTHGRSIYIADVKPLQGLTEETLAKDVHVYDLPEVAYNANWGKSRSKFDEIKPQKYSITYYVPRAADITLNVKAADGTVLRSMKEKAAAGLNTATYDFTIDEAAKEAYTSLLNKDAKETKVALKASDDKKTYLMPGKYTIEVVTPTTTQAREFEVKSRKRVSKRGTLPQGRTTPGEFEEWYEDMGFEDTRK